MPGGSSRAGPRRRSSRGRCTPTPTPCPTRSRGSGTPPPAMRRPVWRGIRPTHGTCPRGARSHPAAHAWSTTAWPRSPLWNPIAKVGWRPASGWRRDRRDPAGGAAAPRGVHHQDRGRRARARRGGHVGPGGGDHGHRGGVRVGQDHARPGTHRAAARERGRGALRGAAHRAVAERPVALPQPGPDGPAGRRRLAEPAAAGLRPPERMFLRYPHELSGGQKQRVLIAGALALRPQILLADEPVSSLDASIRGEILALLLQLREETGVGIVVVTHDLGLAWNIADRIAVMYLGRVVEFGSTEEVLESPRHPYTQALLSVVPEISQLEPIVLRGEIPDPTRIPGGCRF